MVTQKRIDNDFTRSRDIEKIIVENSFDNYEMGLAIVDLEPDTLNMYRIFGYKMSHMIYPASLSKVFVATEVIRQIRMGKFDHKKKVAILRPNVVDIEPNSFPGDNRPLLGVGDCMTIEYLLDLMLSRSDNTATNVLIDLVDRKSINEFVIAHNDWEGSEVTRKYLPRAHEDPEYRDAPFMYSCARHVAEFFYRIGTGSFFGKDMLIKYMGKCNELRPGLWLPDDYLGYYRKGGKYDNKLDDGRIAHWLHDAGIVVGRRSCYAIALLTLDKNNGPESTFPMQRLAKLVFDYMESYK